MCTKHHACRSKSLTQPMHSHQTSCDGSPKIVAIRAAGVSASCDGDSCCTSDGGGGATLEDASDVTNHVHHTISRVGISHEWTVLLALKKLKSH